MPTRTSALSEPADDGPLMTLRTVKMSTSRPSAVMVGASKVKSCMEVLMRLEMVAAAIRPAPVPRGAEQRREVPETYALA